MAQEAGLSQSAISQLENNQILPQPETLQKIAEVFGTTPEKFFQGGFRFEQSFHDQSQPQAPQSGISLSPDVVRSLEKIIESKDELIRIQKLLIASLQQQLQEVSSTPGSPSHL